jgi:hypothetical protein
MTAMRRPADEPVVVQPIIRKERCGENLGVDVDMGSGGGSRFGGTGTGALGTLDET